MINQIHGAHIAVPRELALLFKDNPGAQRAFNTFLNTIAAKLDGSNTSLADIEQRSGTPSLSRLHEVDKQISAVNGAIRSAKARVQELEKNIESMESVIRRGGNISELIKRLDDMDATTRPRG